MRAGGGELDAHAGVVLEDDDLVVVLAAAALAGEELAQLVQVLLLDEAALDAGEQLGLFVEKDLPAKTHHDQARPLNDGVVELVARQVAVPAPRCC